MEKLTKEEVRHVAALGRLKLTKEEEDKYARDLYLLFEEINKVKNINLEGDIMIAPPTNECVLREDKSVEIDNPSKLISLAPNNSLNYIEVAGVFDE